MALRRHSRVTRVTGDRRIAYRSTGLGARLQNDSESFHRASRGFQSPSKRLPSASENFIFFPGIEDYQWLTGEWRPKKSPRPPWGRAPPRRTVPTRENRHPGGLRIPLEACPRPSRFSPFRRGPSTRRRRLVEHIVNNARLSRQSVVFYNSRAEARRSADFPLPSRLKAPGAGGDGPRKPASLPKGGCSSTRDSSPMEASLRFAQRGSPRRCATASGEGSTAPTSPATIDASLCRRNGQGPGAASGALHPVQNQADDRRDDECARCTRFTGSTRRDKLAAVRTGVDGRRGTTQFRLEVAPTAPGTYDLEEGR